MVWMGGKPIYLEGKQIAEVLISSRTTYTIRNLRPNGNVGVCFTTEVKGELRGWLDDQYPGWTQ